MFNFPSTALALTPVIPAPVISAAYCATDVPVAAKGVPLILIVCPTV